MAGISHTIQTDSDTTVVMPMRVKTEVYPLRIATLSDITQIMAFYRVSHASMMEKALWSNIRMALYAWEEVCKSHFDGLKTDCDTADDVDRKMRPLLEAKRQHMIEKINELKEIETSLPRISFVSRERILYILNLVGCYPPGSDGMISDVSSLVPHSPSSIEIDNILAENMHAIMSVLYWIETINMPYRDACMRITTALDGLMRYAETKRMEREKYDSEISFLHGEINRMRLLSTSHVLEESKPMSLVSRHHDPPSASSVIDEVDTSTTVNTDGSTTKHIVKHHEETVGGSSGVSLHGASSKDTVLPWSGGFTHHLPRATISRQIAPPTAPVSAVPPIVKVGHPTFNIEKHIS